MSKTLRKIFYTLWCCLSVVVLTACQADAPVDPTTEPDGELSGLVLRVGHSEEALSRTQMGDSDGTHHEIRWVVGDRVALWARSTSAEEDLINGATFTFATYNAEFNTADFLADLPAMAEDTYHYHACYPLPDSRNGREVSYTLPSTQSGQYDPSLDVMVASTTGNALLPRSGNQHAIPWDEPQLNFSHLFHLIRIRIPEGKNNLGMPIKRIDVIFPEAVAGTVTFDASDPQNTMVWSNTSNKISVELQQGQSMDAGNGYVWLYIKPGVMDGPLRFRGYSVDGKPSQEIMTYIEKEFQPQRITPIALTIPAVDESAYLEMSFSCPDTESYPNFLGENASTMYVEQWPENIKPIAGMPSTVTATGGVFKVKFYGLNNEDYQFNTHLSGEQMRVAFASANANLSHIPYTITLPRFIDTNVAHYALPYLFFEDFSRMTSSCATGEDYDTNIAGVALDASYFTPFLSGKYGWSGSNITGETGTIVLNTKSDRYIGSRAYYRGRLDSAQLPMTGTQTVAVSFDYQCRLVSGSSFSPNMTYGSTTTASPVRAHCYRVVAISYNYGNKVSGTEKALSDGETGTQTYTISGCTGSHRLSWDVFGSGGSGNVSAYHALAVDNVRVSIGTNVKHPSLRYRDFFDI